MRLPVLAVLLVMGYCLRLYTATLGGTWDITGIWVQNSILWHVGGYGTVLDRGEWNNYMRPWWDFLGTLGYVLTPGSHGFRMAVSAVISAFDVGNGILLYLAVGLGGAAFYLLCPLTIIVAGYGAQFDGIVLFFALAGALLVKQTVTDRYVGSLLIGLSIILKPTFVAFPAWLSVRERSPVPLIIAAVPGAILLMVNYDRIMDIYASVVGGSHAWDMEPLWYLLPQLAKDWIGNPYWITAVALALGALLAPRDPVRALAWYSVVFMLTIPDWKNHHLIYVVGAAAILGGWPLYLAVLIASIYEMGDSFGLGIRQFRIWVPAQTAIQGPTCLYDNCERRPVYEAITLCLAGAVLYALNAANGGGEGRA